MSYPPTKDILVSFLCGLAFRNTNRHKSKLARNTISTLIRNGSTPHIFQLDASMCPVLFSHFLFRLVRCVKGELIRTIPMTHDVAIILPYGNVVLYVRRASRVTYYNIFLVAKFSDTLFVKN